MTLDWLTSPQGAAGKIAAGFAALVPVLRTDRLRLRAPVLTDYAAYQTVFTSERARYLGGPFSAEQAYADFCEGVAGWMLRGAGIWTVTLHSDDAPLGWIFLWQEMGDPEPELGWVLTEAAEGHGYAAEAARAALPHATALFGKDGFVSYIDAENIRSARLALALGARRDLAAEAAYGDETLHIYRHSGTGAPL